jgi:hypothetical protein
LSRIIKQHTRTVKCEDREFHLDYCLGESEQTSQYYITALLKTKMESGLTDESTSSVTVPCRQFGEKMFHIISVVSDPVFPVHLPEVVRDQVVISAHNLSQSEEEDPPAQ